MDNSKNDSYYVEKIREDLVFIVKHMQDVDLEELATFDLLQDSMLFRLIQISESARRLSDDYKSGHKTIPWTAIYGLRNRIVHDYNGHRYMSFMLHGHTHKTEESVLEEQIKEQLRAKGQRCEANNVGAMWQDYEPQTLEEIVARQGRTILLI